MKDEELTVMQQRPLMILWGALELWWPFDVVLNREEGFGPWCPHQPVIGYGLFLGRGCDLGQGHIPCSLGLILRKGLTVSGQYSWQLRK